MAKKVDFFNICRPTTAQR